MHVWVIELWDDPRDKWEPTKSACCLDKSEAILELAEWRRANPDDKFRIQKYERVK